MNESSHPIDENLVNTGSWEGSPLMASVRHGGASPVSENQEIEAAAKAPAGAAAPIIMEVWGHQPPSHIFTVI